MLKNKFIRSTLILLVGGFITKLLGMVIRVLMARKLGPTGMGLYMLANPTFSLFISLAQLGLPVAISKLVAEKDSDDKNLVFGLIPVILIFNILLCLIIYLSSSFISNNLLHDNRLYYIIISIGIILPFISISSILRGYFFGKERMFPHVFSNVMEDVIRLILIYLFLPYFLSIKLEYAVCFVILTNICSELTSIIIFILFLPKDFSLSRKDFVPKKSNIKRILKISIPTTGSRLIGNVGFFLEPIILTFIMLKVGYSSDYITDEYGLINGYVLPILMLPSFFTLAITQALIPTISYHHSIGNKKYAKKKVKEAIFFSLLIGIPVTLIFVFIPEIPYKLLYNRIDGIMYTKVLAIIFLFHYVQAPLTGTLQAMGLAKEAMKGTLAGTVIRLLTLFIFSSFKIGMWGLIIATSINIIYVTFHQAKYVKNELN